MNTYPIIHCSSVVIKRCNKILCHQRKDSGLWELPGGKQEENEDIYQTAKRELEEEANLKIKKFGEILGTLKWKDENHKCFWNCTYLEIIEYEGHISHKEPEKGTLWVWKSVDELKELKCIYTLNTLLEVIESYIIKN